MSAPFSIGLPGFDKSEASRSEPFFLSGGGRDAVVLLVHGFTSTPFSMRGLGEALWKAGFDARGMLLPGHGTTPSDLGRQEWPDWYRAVEREYLELKSRYRYVVPCGQSLGGCLCLMLASSYPVTGAVSMACGVHLLGWRKYVLRMLSPFLSTIRKKHGPDIKDDRGRMLEVHYPEMPVRAILQVQALVDALRGRLNRVHSPVLLIHSRQDHTFRFSNMDYLDRMIASPARKRLVLENGYHVVTLDEDRERVKEAVVQFVREVCP
jgi:carboxylesterase